MTDERALVSDDGPMSVREIGEMARTRARNHLLAALDANGVHMELLARVSADLLQATKVKAQYDKGAPPTFDPDTGEIVPGREEGFRYSKPLADNVTRFNTLRLLMEFHDVMPAKRGEVDVHDHRQTRALVNALFEKMDHAGVLGVEETVEGELVDGPAPGEMAALKEQVRRGRVASLNPMEMEDD
jgi:hypothetical protein